MMSVTNIIGLRSFTQQNGFGERRQRQRERKSCIVQGIGLYLVHRLLQGVANNDDKRWSVQGSYENEGFKNLNAIDGLFPKK